MNHPSEIAEILLEILTTGLLRIRGLGWSGDAKRCGIEGDHIHNLPHLVTHCDFIGLAHYWEVERTSYISQTGAEQLVVWERLWRQLQIHVEAPASSTSTR
jgi:hypothetical protein